ncbi:hypothetical protein HMPREF0765_4362 [Sphingobacterium spiritivorum ATCC 33300]|uniref:Uncharacterized protein n=1 Tax=Sphingobacterium spiritivorum ATCC 33300 TaxID=525372 RepID=C2G476_SPHSI|nr:hypothetical protein HMPREF0765_4362 [Sphingobacterium spiritivorum ATCC 33300]
MSRSDFDLWLMTVWPIIGTILSLMVIYGVIRLIMWAIKSYVRKIIKETENNR